MSIIFVNRYFYPDTSATSQMLSDLACGLGAEFEVRVVCSNSRYFDSKVRLPSEEEWRGIDIVRLNSTRFGRSRLWLRAIDSITFLVRVFVHLLKTVRRNDVVVLMTDPPFLSLFNTAAVRLRGGRVVNWIQDVFPEIAIKLGVLPRSRLICSPLIWWRDRTIRAAATNVVISNEMLRVIGDRGITNAECIPNWADGTEIKPLSHPDNQLRQDWNPESCFLVGYSGNFGRAHSFDEMINAMQYLIDQPDIRFVMIGQGQARDWVQKETDRRGLTNVMYKPYQSREGLASSLGAIDLHVVTLKEGMEGLVMPSKLYGAMAAGRPIAFVGDPGKEIAELITRQEIGFVVPCGNGQYFAEQVKLLAQDPVRMDQYRLNARALFEREFSAAKGLSDWTRLLEQIAPGGAIELARAQDRS